MGKNKKFRGRHQQRPQRPEVLPALDMGLLNAARVTLPDWDSVQIVLAGAGGNGSHLARPLVSVARALYEAGKGVHVTICDPDTVEPANVRRQYFHDAEVGQPKAVALMRRLTRSGVNASAFVGKFDESLLCPADLTVLVGCVDRADGRRALHQVLRYNDGHAHHKIWWLDLGNLKDTGRVLLGSGYGYESLRGAFHAPKVCAALPSPALQWPGLLRDAPEDLPRPEMSCAEMAEANLQGLTINARLAAEAFVFIDLLLVRGELNRFAFEANVAAGAYKSIYATPEEVARAIGKPVGHVLGEKAKAA